MEEHQENLIPIRCFTCGKVVAHHWEPFSALRKKNWQDQAILKHLGVHKDCCIRMLVTHEP